MPAYFFNVVLFPLLKNGKYRGRSRWSVRGKTEGGGCIGVVRCCILARKKHNWRVMKRFSMECNQVLV